MNIFDPKSDTFHIMLRKKRNDLNFTQKKLAEELGISLPMIQRYEMDRSQKSCARPGPETTRKIEAYFSQKTQAESRRILEDFSLDQLLYEIRQRGYKITISDL